jgi:hypothetical protein
VALWSPRDGIIAPRSACGWPGERDLAVALRCSHLGFASSPEAIAMVLSVMDSIAPSRPADPIRAEPVGGAATGDAATRS